VAAGLAREERETLDFFISFFTSTTNFLLGFGQGGNSQFNLVVSELHTAEVVKIVLVDADNTDLKT